MTRNSPSLCSLLLLSCDKYRDLWNNCTVLYRKYWPDCPYQAFLASDTKPPEYDGFRPVGAEQTDLSWSDMTRKILDQIDTDYILLMLDDFFLTGPVDTKHVEFLFSRLVALNGGYLRLVPHSRWMEKVPVHPEIGEHQKGLPYRTSLQAAFWKRSTFMSLLVPGESPWQFELYGGLRSDKMKDPFFAAYSRPIPYIDVLERGKWLPRGIKLCRNEGFTIDLSFRPVISSRDKIRRIWSNVIGSLIQRIPNGLRRKIRRYKHREYYLRNGLS